MPDTPYTVFQPDGSQTAHTVSSWPDKPGYKAICAVVLPILRRARPKADLERVQVLDDHEPRDMFVDDMGALVGLPVNRKATAIYRANWMLHHPSDDPDALPSIYGPAVLFGRRVWF